MDYKDYQKGKLHLDFWFRAKRDMIDILLSRCCKKGKSLKILSLGAGTGTDLEILNKYGEVYVIDINKNALNLISKKLCYEKKIANACKLPYKDNFFDIVTSFDVFEHITNDFRAISEARRVLKKGGYLVFSVPAFQFLFSSHDEALEHKRRYNKKMLKNLLLQFNNLKLNYWNSMLFFPIACMRLIKKNSKVEVDSMALPKFVNSFFLILLKIENRLLKYNISSPVGLTLIGYCNK